MISEQEAGRIAIQTSDDPARAVVESISLVGAEETPLLPMRFGGRVPPNQPVYLVKVSGPLTWHHRLGIVRRDAPPEPDASSQQVNRYLVVIDALTGRLLLRGNTH